MEFRRRLFIAALGGALTMIVLVAWRDFFWQLALFSGLGAGALLYSAVGTAGRLRSIYQRPGDESPPEEH